MKKITKVVLTSFLFIASFTVMRAENAGNAPSNIIDIDKNAFLEKVFNYEKNTESWVYEGSTPCIISFYANFCGPCRRLYPTLTEIAREYGDKLIIYRVNVETEKELAAAFGIQGIPLLIFVPVKGKPQAVTGILPKENIENIVNSFLFGIE
ncbi:MAG: thioredoxin family protein [Candidatus Azobacteroides sp.]|nr:thioredoxin family protein [Candidatus Azobacteroides sp.]